MEILGGNTLSILINDIKDPIGSTSGKDRIIFSSGEGKLNENVGARMCHRTACDLIRFLFPSIYIPFHRILSEMGVYTRIYGISVGHKSIRKGGKENPFEEGESI